MPPERYPPDDPREWLSHARTNLALAKAKVPDPVLEALSFEAQQAAEKALKAVLLHKKLRIPRTHNLNHLLKTLQEDGEAIPPQILEAGPLSEYAVESRYPGRDEPLTEEEHQRNVSLAEGVVRWAEAIVGRG